MLVIFYLIYILSVLECIVSIHMHSIKVASSCFVNPFSIEKKFLHETNRDVCEF